MDIILKQGSTGVVEVIPQEDGSIIIRVNEGKTAPKPTYKFHNNTNKGSKDPEDIIEEMKEAARLEYKKGADKDEITKFVKFWEKKIRENGWKGNKFNFDVLFERWMSNAR